MIIHQSSYSMSDRWRWLEDDSGTGCIAFTPLAQGLLTDRYLQSVSEDSCIAKSQIPFLNSEDLNGQKLQKIQQLNQLAQNRGQSLAQMSLDWILLR